MMTTDDFARYAGRLAGRTAWLGAVLSVTGLLISKPVALGMLLGVTGGYLKVRLTTRGLRQFAALSGGGGRGALVPVRLLNYALMGLVLFVAFSTPRVNEWAALAGLLLPNVVTVLDALKWTERDLPEPRADEPA